MEFNDLSAKYKKYKIDYNISKKELESVSKKFSIQNVLISYIINPVLYSVALLTFLGTLISFSNLLADVFVSVILILAVLHITSLVYLGTQKKTLVSFNPLNNWLLVPKYLYTKNKLEKTKIKHNIVDSEIKNEKIYSEETPLEVLDYENTEKIYSEYSTTMEYQNLIKVSKENAINEFLSGEYVGLSFSNLPEDLKDKTDFSILKEIMDWVESFRKKELPPTEFVVLLQFSNEIFYFNKLLISILEEPDKDKFDRKVEAILDKSLYKYILNLETTFSNKVEYLNSEKLRIKELETQNEILEAENLKNMLFTLEKTR